MIELFYIFQFNLKIARFAFLILLISFTYSPLDDITISILYKLFHIMYIYIIILFF